MNKNILVKKVLSKLSKDETVKKKLSKKEVMDLIFDNFVNREELVNDNFNKKDKLDDRQSDILRKIYDYGDVKKLYTYGVTKYGFQIEDLRFDVDPAYVEIKKIK
jgi:hypothetical protein